jgi:disulfide bond formation protein DsbB
MKDIQRTLNALICLIICGVLLSAFGVEFLWREVPCPLCMLQRLCMIGAAIGCMLNVKFGIKASHYGLMLLSSLAGGTVALRQISLHVCPGTPTFGFPVLGLSLYTWSFLVFACVVLSVAGLLFLYDHKEEESNEQQMSGFGKAAFTVLLLVTATNVVTTFFHCGLGPCHD